MTRGIKHEVDRLINDLQAQYFPYKIPKGEKAGDYYVQLSVRPVQLWELAMPENHLQTVMHTLWDGQNKVLDKYKMGLGMIRKMLGVQKIPKFDDKIPKRIVYKDNVAIYPIGIKEDVIDPQDEKENL